MKTLKELNEKAWYRLIKVFYVFLYLPYLFLLIVAYNAGRDVHPPVYPNTIEAA
jgi:ABC-type spermidine/putrescine transport system permease subunit II